MSWLPYGVINDDDDDSQLPFHRVCFTAISKQAMSTRFFRGGGRVRLPHTTGLSAKWMFRRRQCHRAIS